MTQSITGRKNVSSERRVLASLIQKFGADVPERNIDCYSDIGMSGWWGPNGLHQGLHDMNPIHGGFVLELFQQHQINQNHSVAEIGCGGGIFCEFFAKLGFNILGVDRSLGAIEIAKSHANQQKLSVHYKLGDVYALPFADQSFDVVMSSDFLEHVTDLGLAIKEMSRILKPNGLFIFDTIARNAYSVKRFMQLETDGLIPPGTHDPYLFITPEEMISITHRHGIDIAENADNPCGIDIKTIEINEGKFELQEIKYRNQIGTYIGHGFKHA